MWKEPALAIAALLTFGLNGRPQEKSPSDFKIPPEEASRKNPVATTASAMVVGKKRYGLDCAVCHGIKGDGKGDVVDELKLKLRDWRDPASLKDFTDGDLFYIITKGNGAMPGEVERAKPDEIWQTVIYIRSLGQSEPSAKPKDTKPTS